MLGDPAPFNQDIRWVPGGAEMNAGPPIVEVWPISATMLADFIPQKLKFTAQTDYMMGSNNSMLADCGCGCGGSCAAATQAMGCCNGCAMQSASLKQSVNPNAVAPDPGNGSFPVMADLGGSPAPKGISTKKLVIGAALAVGAFLLLKRQGIL